MSLAELTSQHPLTYLPGIGSRTAIALGRYGVRTIGQFARFTYNEVGELLGNSGKPLLSTAKSVR